VYGLQDFQREIQKRTKYLTLFKVLGFMRQSFESNFLMGSDNLPSDSSKKLLFAKKTEEISRMAFEWLCRNVDKISTDKWKFRYGLITELSMFPISNQAIRKSEKNIKMKWEELILCFITQEEDIKAKNSEELTVILKRILSIQPNLDTIKETLSLFGISGKTKEIEKKKGKDEKIYLLINEINNYYKCLENEMKREQISVSYCKNLIMFLQCNLLAKKYQKYDQRYDFTAESYDWVKHHEHNDYLLTLYLCNYIITLFEFEETIIDKELVADFNKININTCPFLRTEQLINNAHELEGKLIKGVYNIKTKIDSINEQHMKQQLVLEIERQDKKSKKEPNIITLLTEYKIDKTSETINPTQYLDYVIDLNKQKFNLYSKMEE
jgi:hypothetical protein